MEFLRNRSHKYVLEPVPEVPIVLKKKTNAWNRMKASKNKPSQLSPEIQSLLRVIGAPLTPSYLNPNNHDGHLLACHSLHDPRSEWAYIVKQYVAAVGGEKALNSIESMCVTGQMEVAVLGGKKREQGGGFVLWQKRPELWCLELMLLGMYKVSTGSDAKTNLPWHHSHACRVPPLPLGHLLQDLNPWSTANLFSNSFRLGDQKLHNEDCFVLNMEVERPSTLSSRSSNVEIVRHAVCGYFSQRTGLLFKLVESHGFRITTWEKHSVSFWESTMETYFKDYRTTEGINIAHRGSTRVTLRNKSAEGHCRRRQVSLDWSLQEVSLDVKGLSTECFLRPGDLMEEEEPRSERVTCNSSAKIKTRILASCSLRFQGTKSSKIVPVDDSDDESDCSDDSDYDGAEYFQISSYENRIHCSESSSESW